MTDIKWDNIDLKFKRDGKPLGPGECICLDELDDESYYGFSKAYPHFKLMNGEKNYG
jgi:hypothetical protein